MKRLFIFAALFFIGTTTFEQTGPKPLRKLNNVPFKAGETLNFRLHYGFINAGTAELTVKPKEYQYKGRDCLLLAASGKSISTFDWFFKVRDRFESFIDAESVMPYRFIRDCNEGGTIIKQQVDFEHNSLKANSNTKKGISIPEYCQDILSAFYYARASDLSNLKANQYYKFPMFIDDEIYQIGFKYIGKEVLETDLGKFKTLVFRPILLTGRVFSKEEGMTIYISEDANKIPIECKADILVGSIKMTLTNFAGLKYPLTSKIK